MTANPAVRLPEADPNQIETPANEPLLIVRRTFDAPCPLVWECYTTPAHLAHFWGPRGTTTVARVDLRVGGVLRFDWRWPDGSGFGYTSVYTEIAAPARMVYRDAPEDWKGGLDGLPTLELLTTIELSEAAGRTTIKVTVRFASLAVRDESVQRGFAGMVVNGNDRFAEYLVTLPRRG
ncbi:MAG TPA: SRPBCC domain-containing protein [Bauldia sp.]|nr:SRPBCC domain-containing protein [Bauldia sp.]